MAGIADGHVGDVDVDDVVDIGDVGDDDVFVYGLISACVVVRVQHMCVLVRETSTYVAVHVQHMCVFVYATSTYVAVHVQHKVTYVVVHGQDV